MYEDRTQNYDPEIHEEYLTHDTPFLLPRHVGLWPMCGLQHIYKYN